MLSALFWNLSTFNSTHIQTIYIISRDESRIFHTTIMSANSTHTHFRYYEWNLTPPHLKTHDKIYTKRLYRAKVPHYTAFGCMLKLMLFLLFFIFFFGKWDESNHAISHGMDVEKYKTSCVPPRIVYTISMIESSHLA